MLKVVLLRAAEKKVLLIKKQNKGGRKFTIPHLSYPEKLLLLLKRSRRVGGSGQQRNFREKDCNPQREGHRTDGCIQFQGIINATTNEKKNEPVFIANNAS